MKNQKGRIQRLEKEVSPKRVLKLRIISHIPGLPSKTITIPASREAQRYFRGPKNEKV